MLEPAAFMGNVERVSRRSPFVALALAVVLAGACSVYGPSDLVGPDSNPFPPRSGGEAGKVSYGGFVNGSLGGSSAFGGYASGGRGGAGATGGAGKIGTGGAASTSGGALSSSGRGGGGAASGGALAGGSAAAGPGGGRATGGANQSTSGGNFTAGAAGEAGDTSSGGTNSGGTSSGGTSTGGTGTGGGAGSSSTGGAPLAPELIDNMEDGNAYILMSESRDGLWYTAVGAGGTVEPSTAQVTMALLTDSPVSGSKKGFHLMGNGGTEWGALGAFDFRYSAAGNPKLPYDASKYKGIKFWIKGAAAASIIVRLPLKDTTLDAKGECTKTADGCENHFQASLDVTTTWKQVTMPWSGATAAFAQEPWGYVLGAFDPTQLIAVQFLVPTATKAEFWVDDISFIP
jgi:hypothetical protein